MSSNLLRIWPSRRWVWRRSAEFFLRATSLLGSLWTTLRAAISRLATRGPASHSPALGFLASPVGAVTGLLGMLPTIAAASVVGYLAWHAGTMRGERRGVAIGYAQHQREVAAATAATNGRVAELEAELEAERAAADARRATAAATATVVKSVPACARSECALPPSAIEAINGID